MISSYLAGLGCRYLPQLYGWGRRWYQWLLRWSPVTLEPGSRLLLLAPPMNPCIGAIRPVRTFCPRTPGRLHLEYRRAGRTYRAVIDPNRMSAELLRLPPEEWIPAEHGTTRVLPLLQSECGGENILPLVEMYAGPHQDFYRDLPWVEKNPHYWLTADGTLPLFADPSRPLALLWDDFSEEALTAADAIRLVDRAA